MPFLNWRKIWIFRSRYRVPTLKLRGTVAETMTSRSHEVINLFSEPERREIRGNLTALDKQVREEGENPSIGMILCKAKKRTVVEYALHDSRKPIGVATYRMVKRMPKELKGQLPSPQEISQLLENIE